MAKDGSRLVALFVTGHPEDVVVFNLSTKVTVPLSANDSVSLAGEASIEAKTVAANGLLVGKLVRVVKEDSRMHRLLDNHVYQYGRRGVPRYEVALVA